MSVFNSFQAERRKFAVLVDKWRLTLQGQRNQHTEKHTKEESQLDTYRDKGTNKTYKTEDRTNYFKRTNKGAKLFKSYTHNKLEMTIQQNPVQQH